MTNEFEKNTVLIEFRRVSKTYQNGKTAVEDCSFSIYKNECLAILGHNGAGKTTLIKLLIDLLKPTSGEIYFSKDCFQKSHSMASVLDGAGAYDDLSVHDNMLFFGSLYGVASDLIEQRYRSILTYFHLCNCENLSFSKLSMGQKRIVSLCRALLTNPKLLIVDELLAGLDPANQIRLLDFLKNYHEKSQCSILFCSHDLQHVSRLAQRVVIISQGQILFTLNMKDLHNYRCYEIKHNIHDNVFLKMVNDNFLFYVRSSDNITFLMRADKIQSDMFLSQNYPNTSWKEREVTLEDIYLAFTKYNCTEIQDV